MYIMYVYNIQDAFDLFRSSTDQSRLFISDFFFYIELLKKMIIYGLTSDSHGSKSVTVTLNSWPDWLLRIGHGSHICNRYGYYMSVTTRHGLLHIWLLHIGQNQCGHHVVTHLRTDRYKNKMICIYIYY